MKIKNNSSLSLKPLAIVFFFSSLIAIVLRCLQMAKYLDPETGFATGGELIGAVIYVVVFLSCSFFTVSSFLSSDAGKIDIHGLKSPILGSIAAVFAISLVYDWVSSFIKSVSSLAEPTSGTGVQALMATGSLPLALQSVFAFFAAVYFFAVASDFYKGKNNSSRFKVLAISAVAWTGMRLIHRFIRQISFIEVSDLFLELIMLAFMAMFFMSFAQVNSGVYSEGFAWRIPGFGLSASLIAITISVARLVFTFINSGAYINSQHPFTFPDFAFSLFVIILCLEIRKNLYSAENNGVHTENKEV